MKFCRRISTFRGMVLPPSSGLKSSQTNIKRKTICVKDGYASVSDKNGKRGKPTMLFQLLRSDYDDELEKKRTQLGIE